MYPFNFHRPASLDDALACYRAADDGLYLAGGQTLIPTLKQRLAAPSDLIDLSRLPELTGIDVRDDRVSIGAFTRHADVANDPAVRRVLPVLADLAGQIGDRQVRAMGTLGGSVANSDPAADYPAALMGLGATLHTNTRSIPADEFFLNLFETALVSGELIVRVDFPVPRRAAYRKFPNPASRYAVVGVLVAEFSRRRPRRDHRRRPLRVPGQRPGSSPAGAPRASGARCGGSAGCRLQRRPACIGRVSCSSRQGHGPARSRRVGGMIDALCWSYGAGGAVLVKSCC
jgi:aerobic carbon-monoxide dehydrogenase medium subunit